MPKAIFETKEALAEVFAQNKLLLLLLLLLPEVDLTVDDGIVHAKEVAFDEGDVAYDAFKAFDVIQVAAGLHD